MEKKSITRVRVGLPAYTVKNITAICSASVKKLETNRNKNYAFDIVTSTGGSSVHLRNLCVTKGNCKKVQELPFEYYLSIDADVGFEVQNVIDAIEIFKKGVPGIKKLGVVGGAYSPKGNYVDKIFAGKFGNVFGYSPVEKWIPFGAKGIQKVDWCGTGFMLIDAKVLRQMCFPYFQCYPIDLGEECHYVTEDIGFCMDISKLGYGIAVDCGNRVAHIQG
jgi:hypothetical protein